MITHFVMIILAAFLETTTLRDESTVRILAAHTHKGTTMLAITPHPVRGVLTSQTLRVGSSTRQNLYTPLTITWGPKVDTRSNCIASLMAPAETGS